MRHAIGRGKAEKYFAAPMADKAAQAREPHAAAPDDARELAVRERQVRGHHENTAPLIASRRILRGKDGLSAQQQIRFAAVVGQREHAEHIALPTDFHNARSGTNAAFESVANHAAARAHRALSEIRLRALKRAFQFFAAQAAVADVVQIAVVAFEHHGIDRAQNKIFLRARIDHMA